MLDLLWQDRLTSWVPCCPLWVPCCPLCTPCCPSNKYTLKYSTDFTKWDRYFIRGWPALTLASPSLARAQARRDRRRIGCAQRMKWARAPTRFGPGKYTRPNPTWACTQYTVWRLTWMLWTMCHLAGLARLALGKTGRAQLDHIQHHLNSSELI